MIDKAYVSLQESVLCGLMSSDNPYQLDFLVEADFTGANKLIFAAILDCRRLGKPFDAASLVEGIGTGHIDILVRHSPRACRDSLSELVNALKVERLRIEVNKILSNKFITPGKIFEAINALQDEIKAPSAHSLEDITTTHDAFMQHILKRRESNQAYEGIQTLLPQIDNLASGLCDTHLIIVAARPSVGKSAFGLFLAGRALMQQKNVMFFSTEMDRKTILARVYSHFLRIPATNLTHFPKNLTERDIELLESSKQDFENLFVEIGFGCHVNKLYDKALALKSQGRLDMLVVDYLQNLSGNGENQVEKLGYISNTLKKIAMDLEVPVIALAQLNRQAQHLDIPTMAEIKGSGTIEQDADLIFLLHQNPVEQVEKHWLICAKNRHGEIKNIPIVFEKPYQSFKEDSPQGRILTKKQNKERL